MKYSFVVYGSPAPQGSKRHVGKGVMIESCKRVKPWRQDVKAAALEARIRCTLTINDDPALVTKYINAPLDGPIRARMVFTLPKPASAPKRRRTWPDRKPDLSKLLRSTEDALVESGIIVDDARIVSFSRLEKVFPGEDPEALDAPGVRIELEEMI